MSCHKDANCYTLYTKTYPNVKDNIDDSIQSINNEILDIETALSGLSIPDDYLGKKVQKEIKEICNLLEDDSLELKTTEKNINTFINGQIVSHKNHYDQWKQMEELKKQKLNENSNNSAIIDNDDNIEVPISL